MSDKQFENRMAALPNRIKHLKELLDRVTPELNELIDEEERLGSLTPKQYERLYDLIDIHGKAHRRMGAFKKALSIVFESVTK